MNYDFDVVVIGAGSAGLFAVSVASNQKASTCLIEKRKLGGECTWYGCVPSKALLRSAMVAHLIKKHGDYGLEMNGKPHLNTEEVMSHVRDIREEIYSHETPQVFEKRGIKVLLGAAHFTAHDTVEVQGRKIKAKKFILCTGSHPFIPPIEGLEHIDYLTNETIFDLKKLPASLIVLGGGPIGLELSQAMSRLGVKVYVVEMLDRILFREDREAVKILENALIKEGVELLVGKKAVRFEKADSALNVTLEDKSGKKEKISAQKVLVAVGRAPNVDGLGLEACGVEYTKKGITVNEYLQTTNKNIFACGDVVGPYQFSHVAAYQAYLCVRNALFKKIAWSKAGYQNVAWSTFTDPELSRVGMTEEEARAHYRDIKVYKTEYSNADRASTDLVKEGLVKVITNRKGIILGAHIVGKEAGEIIQGLLIAKSLKIPLSKIAPVLFIYPTLSELIKKTAAKALVGKMDNPVVKFIVNAMKKR